MAIRLRFHHSSSNTELSLSHRPGRLLRDVKQNHFLNNLTEELCEQMIAHVSNMHGSSSSSSSSSSGGSEDEIPAHAKEYLSLLRESSNSSMSVNRHLLLLASRSSVIECNSGHAQNGFRGLTLTSKLLTDPIECLAQVLGDASSVALVDEKVTQTGKQLWGKLRGAHSAAVAFSSALQDSRRSRDDSSLMMGSKSFSLNPLQRKFIQLVVGSMVSNLVAGTLSSVTGGGVDPIDLSSHLASAAHLSDALPHLQSISGMEEMTGNMTKAFGVLQAAAQTIGASKARA